MGSTRCLVAGAVSLPSFSHCISPYVEAELVCARARIILMARTRARTCHTRCTLEGLEDTQMQEKLLVEILPAACRQGQPPHPP